MIGRDETFSCQESRTSLCEVARTHESKRKQVGTIRARFFSGHQILENAQTMGEISLHRYYISHGHCLRLWDPFTLGCHSERWSSGQFRISFSGELCPGQCNRKTHKTRCGINLHGRDVSLDCQSWQCCQLFSSKVVKAPKTKIKSEWWSLTIMHAFNYFTNIFGK